MIDDYVRKAMATQNEAVERAVERMLVTPGDYGVMVESYWLGWTWHTRAYLTKDVPSMTVAYREGGTIDPLSADGE